MSEEDKLHIKSLVSIGKIEDAIKSLIIFSSESNNEYNNNVFIISKTYQHIKKEQLKGLLSDEDYSIQTNKVSHSILRLIDEEKFHTKEASKKKGFYQKFFIPFLFMMVLGLITFSYYYNSLTPTPTTEKQICQEFNTSNNYKILLIKFSSLNKTKGREVFCENAVFERLSTLVLKDNLSIEVLIDRKENTKQSPLTYPKALELNNKCEIDLIIWGNYEIPFNQDSTLINIRFSTRGKYKERLVSNNSGETGQKKIKTISALAEGAITGTIEDIIYWALGIQKFNAGKYQEAIQNFQKIKHSKKNKFNAIAECYQSLGNFEKAITHYDSTLEIDHLNTMAINNKAVILALNTKRKEALNLLEQIRPTDTSLTKITNYNLALLRDQENNDSHKNTQAISINNISTAKEKEIDSSNKILPIDNTIVDTNFVIADINKKIIDTSDILDSKDTSVITLPEYNLKLPKEGYKIISMKGGSLFGVQFKYGSYFEKGMFIKIYSTGELEFNKDDEVTFKFKNNIEKTYKFINFGEASNMKGTRVFSNHIKINFTDLHWFSNNHTKMIQFINNVSNNKFNYIIPEVRQDDFSTLAKDFIRLLKKNN